jgi:hypothetical protein
MTTVEHRRAPNGFNLVPPPGWDVIPLHTGTQEAMDRIVHKAVRQLPVGFPKDDIPKARLKLTQEMKKVVRRASAKGGMTLYLPTERLHGVALPVSIVASDLPLALQDLGRSLQDDSHPLVDTERHKVVHFRWDGTLTTFSFEPASPMATCEQMEADLSSCSKIAGDDALTWQAQKADQVTSHGLMMWRHGYVVTAISYNAPEGKEVPPIMDAPAISLEKLTELATSEVWFE